MVLLGRDCPLSKCCKMTMYFQFNKDIGGRIICMESLCSLNPLDTFMLDMDLIQTLFFDFPLGQVLKEDEQPYARFGDNFLNKDQFQKLKPSFKKVISSEISRIISRGTHHNSAIRDLIAQ